MTSTDLFRKVEIIVEEECEGSDVEEEEEEEEEESTAKTSWTPSRTCAGERVEGEGSDQSADDDVDVVVYRPSGSPPLPALARSITDDRFGPALGNDCDDVILPTLAKSDSSFRILEPSADALLDDGELHPCPTCGRKFVQKTFDRHIKICEKVATKKRKVFDGAKKRLEGLPDVPAIRRSDSSAKKKPAKPEDEFQKCPHCARNFGPKAFDRHVQWCQEKSRRMQVSPTKDMVALAKLHARVAYRPKTPNRKDSGGGSPQKNSFTNSLGETPASSTSMTSTDGGDQWTRSLSRDSTRKTSAGSSSGTRSLGRAGGISFLDTVDHTKETPDTQFIRAATGRGSIKRGPAPTKSSVLRQQGKTVISDERVRSKTPNVPRRVLSPVVTTPRKAASPGFALQSNGHHLNNNNNYSYLIKPSAVRPGTKSSVGLRREPEGIENVIDASDKMSDRGRSVSSTRGLEPLMNIGQYDHSQEYDPYQSAARQMQELLFGASPASPPIPRQQAAGAPSAANLRPSTNSAFQRYVPSPTVPSTADINSKFLSAKTKLESYMTLPKKTLTDAMRQSWDGGVSARALPGSSNNNKSWSESYHAPAGQTSAVVSARNSAKVAKFCHECGNPFALPDIRFCCECGVKRLYC